MWLIICITHSRSSFSAPSERLRPDWPVSGDGEGRKSSYLLCFQDVRVREWAWDWSMIFIALKPCLSLSSGHPQENEENRHCSGLGDYIPCFREVSARFISRYLGKLWDVLFLFYHDSNSHKEAFVVLVQKIVLNYFAKGKGLMPLSCAKSLYRFSILLFFTS